MDKNVEELSSGNKRKLCIIISIMNNPNIIMYDEATCGVDIRIRRKLKDILNYFKEKNNSISIFTTHFLKDIEIFCDKIGIIEKGQFLCINYIDLLKKNLGGYVLKIIYYEENQKPISKILKHFKD